MYIYVKYIIFYLLYLLFYICVICSILYIKNIYFICWSKLCSVGGVYVKHSPASPFLCPSLPPGGAGGAGEAADAGGLAAPRGGEGPAGSLAGHGRAGAGRGAATHPAVAGGWPFARPGRGGGCRWWHPWMLPPRSMHPLLAVEWGWAPFGAHPSLGRCWRFY